MASIVPRRSTTSTRLRESRVSLTASGSSGRGLKPASMDVLRDETSPVGEPNVLRKRKSSTNATPSSSQPGSLRAQRPLSGLPEATSEQSRKSANLSMSRSSDVEVQAMLDPRSPRKHGKSKRRDRSASRDASTRPSARSAHQLLGEDSGGSHRYSRAHDDYHKLKEELETVKKVRDAETPHNFRDLIISQQLSSYKKTMGKQGKVFMSN